MNAVDPGCMRVDTLQAMRLIGEESAFLIAERAGYDERDTVALLRTLLAEGVVEQVKVRGGCRWRVR